MSILHDQARLRQAAEAILEADQSGHSRNLDEVIQDARREFRHRRLDRSCGEPMYVNSLATRLHRLTGVPFHQCRSAVQEAVSPDWSSVAIGAIIGFAADNSMEAYR